MAIQMKRQGGGQSSSATAVMPSSLAYGEIGVDSAGNIYCGNGKAQVTSQVKNAANVLFLYKGTYKKDGWVENSANGTWSQTVAIAAQDGGPAIKSDFTLSAPMAAQTDNRTTNEQRQDALGTIAAGKCTPNDSGQITCLVFEKPSIDLDVYWYARLSGGYDSMVDAQGVGTIVNSAVNKAIDDLKSNITSIVNDAINDSNIYTKINSVCAVYRAKYLASGWTAVSSNGYNYYQEVTTSKVSDGNANLNASSIFLTPGFFLPSGTASTDAAYAQAMGIINDGYSTSGTNKIMTYTTTKPTSDIWVYWVVREAV